MNALMNVQVRILTLEARQRIRELEMELRRFRRSVNGTGLGAMSGSMDRATASTTRYTAATRGAVGANTALTSSFGRAMTMGTKFGNQMQWTGRQLQYNFALPIALAGTWAVNAAMQQEKAMTRVAKVYGDGTQSAQTYSKELEALADNFTALSNKFGVAREDVIAIAGDWAAAGAEAGALSRGVRVTMEAMVLGEIDAATATKALIAIQAQYGYSTSELVKTVADLNMIENETGTTMSDLIQSMSRSAAVARQLGVGHRELAALTAALVPATGTATMAGNGLKTMLTRLMAPTNEAADAMKEMGIEIYDTSWQSLSATERLEKMAKSYQTLSEGQRIYISDLVAGKWQISKWSQLMADLASKNGYYAKSLKATNDEAKVFQQYQSELGKVLASNPQKFQQAGQIIRNSLADAIIPLLPYIVFLAQKVAQLAQAFANMNPYAQGAVLALLSFLLVFGPLLRYMGSSLTLFATLGDALRWVGVKFLGMGGQAAAGAATTQAAVASTTGAVAAGGNAQAGLMARTGTRLKAITATTWGGIVATTKAANTKLVASQVAADAAKHAQTSRWAAAQAAIHARTAGVQGGIWNRWYAAHVGGQARFVAGSNGITDLHAKSTVSKYAAASAAVQGIWARTHAAGTAAQARYAATSHAIQQRALGTAIGVEHVFNTKRKAIWAAATGMINGNEARAGAQRIGLQQRLLGTMISLEHIYNTKRKAAWATTAAFISTGEGRHAAQRVSIQQRALGMMIGMEHAFNTKRKAAVAAAGAFISTSEARHATQRVTIQQRAQTIMTAMEQGFHAKRKAAWAATSGFITAGHAAQMQRIAGLSRVGLSAHAATETAFLGASRAKWAAYWTSLGAMQRGAAAKQLSVQAATSAKSGVMAIATKLPFIAAILAMIGIAYHFRDEIKELFRDISSWVSRIFVSWVPFFQKLNNKIVEAFWRLPKGVRDAMLAVVRVVKAAAMAVYDMFSYLNPFARHSPSLVESVEKGMGQIATAYSRVGNVGGIFAKAAADLAKFKTAAAALGRDEWADARADVAEAFPSMLPMFKVLIADLGQLNGVLAQQEAAVKAQKAVVEQWETALENANATLDAHQLKLDSAKNHLDTLTDAYDTHKSSLEAYASAPIAGMGAMEDKIFDNEMAQKKLRLEMLKWEDANGSIDSVRDRLGLLQGDIETARGEAADLRQAGAGSDILGPIEAEIAAMEAQYKATEKAMQDSPISAMQKELEELQRQGEILDLEKSIEFDPLTRAIDKLANAQQELTYDEIIKGINTERAAMAELEPQIASATAAVAAQEEAVKAATAARDQIAQAYDVEKTKLQGLEDEYQKTETLIRDIESALNDMGSAANKAISDAKAAAQAANELTVGDKFDAMADADFPDVGGDAGIGREGDINDILAETEALTRETAAMFGKIDFLKPIKDAWGRVVEWWNTSAWPVLEPVLGTIGTRVREAWGKLFDGQGIEMSGIKERFEEIGTWIGEKIAAIREIGASLWRLLGDDITQVFTEAWKSIKKSFGDIGKEVGKFGELLEPLKKAGKEIWENLKTIFTVGGVVIIALWKVMWSTLSHIIGPIIDTISDIIENALQIIRGIIKVILGAISGDWKTVLSGIKDIVLGFVDLVWDIFKGFGRILFGIVRGIVEGVFGFFQWVYRETIGKAISPMIDDIKGFFSGLWGGIKGSLNAMNRGMASVFNAMGEAIVWGVNIGISAINALIGALNWVGKNVPGLDFEISTIGEVKWKKYSPPQFATGGVLPEASVGEGFVTNKARAIVGEGGRHPEYVIPTDPKHRNNALRLYGELGQAIGGWGFDIPDFDPIGTIKSGVGKVADVAGDVGSFVRRNAVMVAAQPFLKTFDTLMKPVPNKPEPLKKMVMQAKNNIYNWLKGVDGKLPTEPPPGTIGGEVISGSGWSAIENWLRNASDPTRTITSTFRRGDPGYHGRGMAVDYSTQHRNGGYNDPGLRRIFDALLPAAGSLSELILAGAPFNIKDGRKVAGYAWGQPGQPGNHWNHVHAALKQNLPAQTSTRGGFQEFAKGGIAHNPTMGVFGEAGSEILSPLAPLWARFDQLDKKMELLPQGGGDTVINFYGDLSFPNISSGDDAEAFITNLETLARR